MDFRFVSSLSVFLCDSWFFRCRRYSNYALTDIQRLHEQGMDIQAAVASKTDEPEWARICMQHMAISDNATTSLADCFQDRVEISYGSKVGHITRLHKATGIALADMAFFDNEYGNIQSVSKALPAVKCYYTPDGMTCEAWDKAKADFGVEWKRTRGSKYNRARLLAENDVEEIVFVSV